MEPLSNKFTAFHHFHAIMELVQRTKTVQHYFTDLAVDAKCLWEHQHPILQVIIGLRENGTHLLIIDANTAPKDMDAFISLHKGNCNFYFARPSRYDPENTLFYAPIEGDPIRSVKEFITTKKSSTQSLAC